MSIIIEKLNIGFEGQSVLCDLTMQLPDNRLVCLLGPSGIGKTTLLNCLAGLRVPDSGNVCGMEGKKISMVFQENRLLPWFSALENVAMAVDGDLDKAKWALEQMELADEADKQPKELSGGMQRRVAIARALAYDGDVLFLDEPTAGLDEDLSVRIMERIIDVWHDRLVLIITHESWITDKFECVKYYIDATGKCKDTK